MVRCGSLEDIRSSLHRRAHCAPVNFLFLRRTKRTGVARPVNYGPCLISGSAPVQTQLVKVARVDHAAAAAADDVNTVLFSNLKHRKFVYPTVDELCNGSSGTSATQGGVGVGVRVVVATPPHH